MNAEGKKVLIADDEPDVHAFVKAVLREDGISFLSADNGQSAIDMAKAEAPDLIILDVQMPRKNGFLVFRELREDAATKSIPVIMLTAVTERTGIDFNAETMGQYFGSEPEKYIAKPIDPETLRTAVLSLIGGETAQ